MKEKAEVGCRGVKHNGEKFAFSRVRAISRPWRLKSEANRSIIINGAKEMPCVVQVTTMQAPPKWVRTTVPFGGSSYMTHVTRCDLWINPGNWYLDPVISCDQLDDQW